MQALHGAFASGLLPGPQTASRLGLLLVASAAAHAVALGSLPKWMSGVAPGVATLQSRTLKASLRPAPVTAPAAPAAAMPEVPASPPSVPLAGPSPATAPPIAGPGAPRVAAAPAQAAPPPATPPDPGPAPPPVPAAAPAAGPVVAPVASPGPPAKVPAPDPNPRRGSELAAPGAKGPLAGPSYLQLKEVDQRPAPITRIEPVYPPEAGQAEGRVVVRLLINEDGGIDKIEIVAAEPPGLFERATIDAFGSARYQPALKSNVRVKSQITFEIRFFREDAPPSPGALPPMRPTGPPG